jgi:hypothetical protein
LCIANPLQRSLLENINNLLLWDLIYVCAGKRLLFQDRNLLTGTRCQSIYRVKNQLFFLLLIATFLSFEGRASLEDPNAGAGTCDATCTGLLLSSGNLLKGQPYPQFSKKDHEATDAPKREWEWSLPYYAQRVIDKGFNLPRPYGVSLIYFHQNQGLEIGKLNVAFDDTAPLQPIDFVNLHDSKVTNTTWQLKADAWLLPFLDAYVIGGYVEGVGNVPISISAADMYNFFIPGFCSGGSGQPAACNNNISANAPINYNGYNYGLGILLATAYEDYFFAMPITYAITNVNVSTDDVIAINVTPRIGYNFTTATHGKVGVYAGANYLSADVYLSGTYSLPMSGTPIGHDVDVRYKIHESPTDKWNAVIGANWSMSDLWSLVIEIGHSAHRDSQTINLGYRL